VLAPGLPTTGQPVANSQSGFRASIPIPSRRFLTIAAGGVLAVGVVVSGISWVVSAVHGTAPTGAASSTTTATAIQVQELAPPTATSEPASNETSMPAIAATDLPTAAATATARAAPAQPSSAPKPAASEAPAATPTPALATLPPAPTGVTTPAAKPNCSPPYTLDPKSGKKHFKLECL
jgi:hypothetical protein